MIVCRRRGGRPMPPGKIGGVFPGLLLILFLCGALFLGPPANGAADFRDAPLQLAVLSPNVSPAPDAKLRVLAQALAIIEDQYAEPKTTKHLVYGAIHGAMGTLDPHSSFMTPEEFKELQIETKGKFSGIGI